jgi:hypothetical protein
VVVEALCVAHQRFTHMGVVATIFLFGSAMLVKEDGRSYNGRNATLCKSNRFGSSSHSSFRRVICRRLPTFFYLAFSVASTLPR